MNENNVCGCVTEGAPSIQDWLNAIKGNLADASITLEKTLEVLRGGSTEKRASDTPRSIGCVMEDLEATVGMAERVCRLATELSVPFQG